jgi:hypothetical protein
VNRDVLNAYLLHQMPEEERSAFSEQWETDPSILDELQMAEADLLDAYVRDSISPRERSLIEEHLLSSEGQLQKLAFAEALRASLPHAGHSQPSEAVFRVRSNRWVSVMMGTAAAVTVLAVGGTIWLEQHNQRLQREIALLRQTSESPRPDISRPSTSALDTTFFTASLVADDVRGASNVLRIQLPDRAEVLRLELQLEPGDESDRYRATLTTGGRVIWSEEPVVPAPRGRLVVAYVWIPKDLLVPGNYSLTLTGSKGSRAASYRFALGR